MNAILPPVMLFKDAKGQLIHWDTEDGMLVPFFAGGFSPQKFILGLGIKEAIDGWLFDNLPKFVEFLRTIIANPSAFRIAGFVMNPTEPDLRKYQAIPPADLLAQLGP